MTSFLCLIFGHSYQTVKSNEKACTEHFTCKRCGYVAGTHITHKFGVYKYKDQSCYRVKICENCGTERHELTKGLHIEVHDWSEWQYEHPHECQMSRKCSHCGKIEKKTEHMLSLFYSDESGNGVAYCVRGCGHQEIKEEMFIK